MTIEFSRPDSARYYAKRVFAHVILNAGITVIMVLALYKHFFENGGEQCDHGTVEIAEPIDIVASQKKKKKKEKDPLVPALSYYYSKLNIPVEELSVETEDGFTLEMWHLKHPTDTLPNGQKRKAFLCIHGLLQSSGSFASGGEHSLAYYLYSQGFDVWLGNNRIGFEINKKIKHSPKCWNWDMRELVQFDLPAMVQFVRARSGNEKINLLGHSQGTAEIFLGLINNCGGINKYVDNFVALSPACYPGSLLLKESAVMKIMSRTIDNDAVFGNKSFVKIMMVARRCLLGTQFFSFICYLFFNYLFEWNDTLWDNEIKSRHFMFSPVHVSVKLMQWWLSTDPNKVSFLRHAPQLFPEHHTWWGPEYKQEDRPNVLLFVPRKDKLVDGQRVIDHFQNYEDKNTYKYWVIDEYSHLDVLWAKNVNERIGKTLVENLR
ncbi:uncharacterized protein KNAG_0H02540 [Huiozyma naganishii CBS 8797]|uniref:Partial AB-hydrolase lipase domain-containing protein n=1 Tax=Huiozyma naganishii (strain ATCC MYA-139 / BCRC 22969 / CBS 8797 / KCTC 17520 / NBRC 10181 / NCYC 3082 / Yp74L-3) TaxID=1071383 RepID=J7S8P4_HUIN7|nr:hypothetical protein KNAG_0H02540 [Kazachstania naganishii CBS 8797]CCK71669.1 hypothetical protein KNAG_0H02540 [Kazachstania naganishii CBS 8797]